MEYQATWKMSCNVSSAWGAEDRAERQSRSEGAWHKPQPPPLPPGNQPRSVLPARPQPRGFPGYAAANGAGDGDQPGPRYPALLFDACLQRSSWSDNNTVIVRVPSWSLHITIVNQ